MYLLGYTRREPKNPEFIYKKLCIYSYMFKFQSPSKCSPFDAVNLSRCFPHGSKQFWTIDFDNILCFTSSTSAKLFHLRTLFIWGNKKCHLRQDWVNREGRAWGSCCFWSKTADYWVGRYTCKSPIMKWANTLKESSKKNSLQQIQPLTTPPAGTLIQLGS